MTISGAFCFVASVACGLAIQNSLTAAEPKPSPAESSVDAARQAISEKPGDSSGYNLLGAALVRRAQETCDDSYYDQAQDAVRKSLSLTPANFEARKIEVLTLLGKHDYPAALIEAKALNKKVPDDVMVYGLLTEAQSELGNYKEAEDAAQWMLNLRPGNLPAFANAAHLRELFGDMNGSYEAYDLAYQATSPTEDSDRAALLTRMGRERRLAGDTDAAEKILKQALEVFPRYCKALGELAEVQLAKKNYNAAIALFRQIDQTLQTSRTIYELAGALALGGHADEAKAAYASFLGKALAQSGRRDNSNRELVFYYADYAHEPAKALEIAKQEYSWRRDIYTLDAYAWALHVSGQEQEALKQINIALAVGTRDPKILAHSERIKPRNLPASAAR